jgi:hypothetical protein
MKVREIYSVLSERFNPHPDLPPERGKELWVLSRREREISFQQTARARAKAQQERWSG